MSNLQYCIPHTSTKTIPFPRPRQLNKRKSLTVISSSSLPQRKWRIALYSHDTMGLGHKRRNILIAQTLGISALNADILMISGMGEGNQFQTPPGIDCLTLPALYKNSEGKYQARRLDISLSEIITMRSQIIRTTLQNFKPDILMVDNVPRGAMGELNATLKYLHTQTDTLCILGLRDILDEPEVIRRDWKRNNHEDVIRRYYDAVWVYGDPKVYNLTEEYGFAPDIAAKFRYTGYLDQRSRLQFTSKEHLEQTLNLPSGRLALCVVGGGQDGGNLAQAFAQSELPANTNGIIITGPMMPQTTRQQIQALVKNRSNLRVLEYVPEPTLLLKQADWVVSMGGYNTTCEILSFGKRALIVPRVQPRKEQLIRVQRLQELGLVDLLHPNQLTAQAISAWLAQKKPAPQIDNQVNLQGLDSIPQFLAEMLYEKVNSTPSVINI